MNEPTASTTTTAAAGTKTNSWKSFQFLFTWSARWHQENSQIGHKSKSQHHAGPDWYFPFWIASHTWSNSIAIRKKMTKIWFDSLAASFACLASHFFSASLSSFMHRAISCRCGSQCIFYIVVTMHENPPKFTAEKKNMKEKTATTTKTTMYGRLKANVNIIWIEMLFLCAVDFFFFIFFFIFFVAFFPSCLGLRTHCRHFIYILYIYAGETSIVLANNWFQNVTHVFRFKIVCECVVFFFFFFSFYSLLRFGIWISLSFGLLILLCFSFFFLLLSFRILATNVRVKANKYIGYVTIWFMERFCCYFNFPSVAKPFSRCFFSVDFNMVVVAAVITAKKLSHCSLTTLGQ